MKREKNMADYKYFKNVEKNAYFTEVPCQFCGSKHLCLDGVFFEKENITSICLDCFNKKRVKVSVPDYIQARVIDNRDEKVNELQCNPPVPWIQSNDWPVCCDDYMVYIGEWEQDDFTSYSKNESGKDVLKKLISPELLNKVDSFDALWDDLGYGTATFAFQCKHCGKIVIVCQDY